jgi:succinate dehydrogenase / fumarate reductase flavoprotein subunit
LETIQHDVIILGTGLAGLRAAIEALKVSKGQLSVGVVSKVHLMRSHSVAPEGGAAAVLSENDSFEQHAFDTIKGSDFLADQDVVEEFVRRCPEEILQLEHWGCPWSRNEDGSIALRLFGAHEVPRTVYAEDRTGHFLMRTLYDTLLKYENFVRYDEFFALSLVIEDGRFEGLLALDRRDSSTVLFEAKSIVIATGGLGRLWEYTTNAHTTTGDGFAIAYRAGIPLKDMEFVQWLPTCMVPHGIPATEALRGHGAIMLNSENERFMKKYAPNKMELAARDIVSRAMIQEISEGRGFEGPGGMGCVMLDARPVGEDKLLSIYLTFVENARDFLGIDPLEELVPVRPAAHFSMGGIDVDIGMRTAIPNIFSAGEVACASIDGANRLGSNSLPMCLVTGAIAGRNAAMYAMKADKNFRPSEKTIQKELKPFEELMGKTGSESVYSLKRRLNNTMENYVGVFRDEIGLLEALKSVTELKKAYNDIFIGDKSKYFNVELIHAIELGFMLDVAEVIIRSALMRRESRGAHYRTDFPKRDDKNWLKHTVAKFTRKGVEISYKPVTITKWQPVERKY